MYGFTSIHTIDTELFAQEISGGDYVAGTQLVKKRSLMKYSGDALVSFIRIATMSSGNVPKVRDKCIDSSPDTLTLPFHTRLRKS
jgi:hypothetical protein